MECAERSTQRCVLSGITCCRSEGVLSLFSFKLFKGAFWSDFADSRSSPKR